MEPDFVLTDLHGRPIPSNQMTERMRESLKEFLDKNRPKLLAFWREEGFGLRPPVVYDLDNKRWIWVD